MIRRLLLILAIVSCSGAPPKPEPIPTGAACGWCRMAIGNPRLAAQIVAAGEETLFFDDIGCLRSYQKSHEAVAYVADYRTGAWIDASRAQYVKCESIETPMSSHLIAFAPEKTIADCESVQTVRDRVESR